jgi:hypothetical protein
MMFDFSKITEEDRHTFSGLIGSLYREPDLVITGDDEKPYLYRWWVTPHSQEANVYAHIQVASDPARPLHDHPWDNMSVILSGGYREKLCHFPSMFDAKVLFYPRKKGDAIFRKAEWAHRLILPAHIPYAMTLFSTGPKIREWGFWHGQEWHSFSEWCKKDAEKSVWVGPTVEDDSDAPNTI